MQNLLERNSDGISVSIDFDPETNSVFVVVKEGENGHAQIAQIPSDSVFEAFNHPYCFLPVSNRFVSDVPEIDDIDEWKGVTNWKTLRAQTYPDFG